MFDPELKRVALIRKAQPAWQKGLLNGIGGKMEESDGHFAITNIREFKEETGMVTTEDDWRTFCIISSNNTLIHFFVSYGPIDCLKTQDPEPGKERESIVIADLDDIFPTRTDLTDGLVWQIALALDVIKDGRPQIAHVTYPNR